MRPRRSSRSSCPMAASGNTARFQERCTVASWRSNWTFPRFDTEAEGLEAMKRVASDAGANGLLHAICVNGAIKASDKPMLYCYGDAIKVN